ncbi:hypothetical protein KAI92_05185 [Candidatus Parcubacteria bacterium]|nr:hypothetical protein [Candidatus Parcubacteria bacterium]
MKLYQNILLESLKLTWKNKYLWFFGLFTSLFFGGGISVLFTYLSGRSDTFVSIVASSGIFNIFKVGRAFIEQPLVATLVLIFWLFIILLAVFLIWLSNVSRIAIVNGVFLDRSNEKGNINKGVLTGMKYFWPVFLLSIFLSIITYSSSCLTNSLIGLVEDGAIPGTAFSVPFVLLVILVVILSFVVKYAIAYVVLKKQKIQEAINNAWKLFLANWLISLEMAFLLFLVNIFTASALFVIGGTLITSVLFFVNLIGSVSIVLSFWLYVVATLLIIIFTAICLAVILTFQFVVWTNLFIELTTKGATSRLIEIFHKK